MVLTGEAKLAQAVLALAAEDATTLDPSVYAHPEARVIAGKRQAGAREFLKGGPMLAFWCQLAGVDAETITAAAMERWP